MHIHSNYIGSLGGFIKFCYWKYKIATKIYLNEKEKISTFLKLLGLKENESFIIDNVKNKRIESLALEFLRLRTNHVKMLNSYYYKIKLDKGNDIFYIGNTYEIKLM